jgi:hypothetical protein
MYTLFLAAHSASASLRREGAMTQANLRLVEDTSKTKAFGSRVRAFRKSSIVRLRKKEDAGLGMIEAIEADTDLFTVAEQVDLAEKAFHDALARRNDALARRNEAHIAYLLQPSIEARETFKAAKAAEAVALEILDAEVGWLASLRATTVIGLKLKASYAAMEGKLADSIVEDILKL